MGAALIATGITIMAVLMALESKTGLSILHEVQYAAKTPDALPSCQTPAWYRFFRPAPASDLAPGLVSQNLILRKAKAPQQANFLPFELVNPSSSAKILTTQNGSLIMIQEALDPQGKWAPIEYWDFNWEIGSDTTQFVLMPQHAVLVMVPTFTGDFATKIRLKLTTSLPPSASQVIYSEVFEGTVKHGQFKKPASAQVNISYLDGQP